MKTLERSGITSRIWQSLSPRRSLVASVMWLVVALAVFFSVGATIWVGSIARESVIAQHTRRMSLETDGLSSALTQALAERLSAIRVTETLLRSTSPGQPDQGLRDVYAELRSAYPQLDWMALARSDGTLLEGGSLLLSGDAAGSQSWQKDGLAGPWIGSVEDRLSAGLPDALGTSLGDMAAPVHDASGQVIGVICARLSWRRTEHRPQRLTDQIDGFGDAIAFVLDRKGVVLVGPKAMRGREWAATYTNQSLIFNDDASGGPLLETLPSGAELLVARQLVSLSPEYPNSSWVVQLIEPRDRAYQRADTLRLRIFWASSLLAAFTALLGIIGAKQVTLRLRQLADSVTATGVSDSGVIDIPHGIDEVAQLGAAFAKILGELHRERRELERRVAVRTREVERLADDARYAAIVRERLSIARELHDTLAHSMMAMLSVIRYLRRLQTHDAASVAKELARAEEVAHEGLQEARRAITQMRANSTIRETGLGEALSQAIERLVNRIGIKTEVSIDPDAARFADERAETILRMAQETLRNVERHSLATTLMLTLQVGQDQILVLQIRDDGVGFDLSADTPGHYGLVGLREQAELIGAKLSIRSTPNGGTQVKIELQLSPVSFGFSRHEPSS